MIGDWVDESEDSTVETSCRWTKNRNYMTRSFRLSVPGTDDLEGTQVVGWDPAQGVIRSWLFDSDGGHLQGVWSENDGSWIVKSSGYLADGRRASSVNVFSPVDADSFTWKAIDRRVEDEFIPDTEEVKVVRKQAQDSASQSAEGEK